MNPCNMNDMYNQVVTSVLRTNTMSSFSRTNGLSIFVYMMLASLVILIHTCSPLTPYHFSMAAKDPGYGNVYFCNTSYVCATRTQCGECSFSQHIQSRLLIQITKYIIGKHGDYKVPTFMSSVKTNSNKIYNVGNKVDTCLWNVEGMCDTVYNNVSLGTSRPYLYAQTPPMDTLNQSMINSCKISRMIHGDSHAADFRCVMSSNPYIYSKGLSNVSDGICATFASLYNVLIRCIYVIFSRRCSSGVADRWSIPNLDISQLPSIYRTWKGALHSNNTSVRICAHLTTHAWTLPPTATTHLWRRPIVGTQTKYDVTVDSTAGDLDFADVWTKYDDIYGNVWLNNYDAALMTISQERCFSSKCLKHAVNGLLSSKDRCITQFSCISKLFTQDSSSRRCPKLKTMAHYCHNNYMGYRPGVNSLCYIICYFCGMLCLWLTHKQSVYNDVYTQRHCEKFVGFSRHANFERQCHFYNLDSERDNMFQRINLCDIADIPVVNRYDSQLYILYYDLRKSRDRCRTFQCKFCRYSNSMVSDSRSVPRRMDDMPADMHYADPKPLLVSTGNAQFISNDIIFIYQRSMHVVQLRSTNMWSIAYVCIKGYALFMFIDYDIWKQESYEL